MFQTINQIKSAVGNKQIGSKDTTNVPRKKKGYFYQEKLNGQIQELALNKDKET